MNRRTKFRRLVIFAALALLTLPVAPQTAYAQAGRAPAPNAAMELLAAERDKLMELMRRAADLRAAGSEDLADAEREAAGQVDRVYNVLVKLLLTTSNEGVVDTIQGLRELQDARLVDLLKQVNEARAARDKYNDELAALTAKLAESESRNAMPPLEEADIKVFSLRHVNAVQAAQTIDSLLGPGPVRVAVDERTNALIVAGKSESLTVIEALLLRLDEQAARSDEESTVAAEAQRANQARSLLLRVFWLADGLPEGEGQDPAEFLPASVTKALERLGLTNPRLVTQTVNSLAQSANMGAKFNSSVPVVLDSWPLKLTCEGSLESAGPDQVRLKVGIYLPNLEINVDGSLVTPLGHYTVLGTANSVMADAATRQAMAADPKRPFETAEERERRLREGDANPGVAPPFKYNTSHFAFVVQVIEGENFPAEE